MIPNRRKFWENLDVTENVRDYDDDEDLALERQNVYY